MVRHMLRSGRLIGKQSTLHEDTDCCLYSRIGRAGTGGFPGVDPAISGAISAWAVAAGGSGSSHLYRRLRPPFIAGGDEQSNPIGAMNFHDDLGNRHPGHDVLSPDCPLPARTHPGAEIQRKTPDMDIHLTTLTNGL